MACFGGSDECEHVEPDGICPDCGTETYQGESIFPSCCYSPVICKTCNDQPCDESC